MHYRFIILLFFIFLWNSCEFPIETRSSSEFSGIPETIFQRNPKISESILSLAASPVTGKLAILTDGYKALFMFFHDLHTGMEAPFNPIDISSLNAEHGDFHSCLWDSSLQKFLLFTKQKILFYDPETGTITDPGLAWEMIQPRPVRAVVDNQVYRYVEYHHKTFILINPETRIKKEIAYSPDYSWAKPLFRGRYFVVQGTDSMFAYNHFRIFRFRLSQSDSITILQESMSSLRYLFQLNAHQFAGIDRSDTLLIMRLRDARIEKRIFIPDLSGATGNIVYDGNSLYFQNESYTLCRYHLSSGLLDTIPIKRSVSYDGEHFKLLQKENEHLIFQANSVIHKFHIYDAGNGMPIETEIFPDAQVEDLFWKDEENLYLAESRYHRNEKYYTISQYNYFSGYKDSLYTPTHGVPLKMTGNGPVFINKNNTYLYNYSGNLIYTFPGKSRQVLYDSTEHQYRLFTLTSQNKMVISYFKPGMAIQSDTISPPLSRYVQFSSLIPACSPFRIHSSFEYSFYIPNILGESWIEFYISNRKFANYQKLLKISLKPFVENYGTRFLWLPDGKHVIYANKKQVIRFNTWAEVP